MLCLLGNTKGGYNTDMYIDEAKGIIYESRFHPVCRKFDVNTGEYIEIELTGILQWWSIEPDKINPEATHRNLNNIKPDKLYATTN